MSPSETYTEQQRLAALAAYSFPDPGHDAVLDSIAELAAEICGVSMSAINIIDGHRQWAKATFGAESQAFDVPREDSFCSTTIEQRGLFAVPDAKREGPFRESPLVTGDLHVGFYAGVPLRTPAGEALGALCVLDTQPRSLSPAQSRALVALAEVVMRVLETHQPTHRLGALIEQSPNATLFFEFPSWRWRHVNNSALKSLGLQSDEVASSDPPLFSPAYRPEYLTSLLAPLISNQVETITIETEHRPRERRAFPVEVVFSLGEDRGDPIILAFVRDLSEREQLQLERQERQRFFDMASELFLILRHEGRVLQANRRVSEVLGYSSEEMAARSPWDFVDSQDREAALQSLKRCIETGSTEVQLWFLRADGVRRLLRFSARSQPDDLIYVVGYDITESYAEQRRLHLLERAFEASDNPLIISEIDSDPTGAIEYVNPAFERVTGYTAAEAVGRNCNFLQSDDRPQPGVAEMRRAILKRLACEVSLRNYRKDGTLFYNNIHLSPVVGDDGSVTHYVGLQYDITLLKNQQERLLRLDRIRALVDAVRRAIVREHSEQSLLQEVCDAAVGHGGFSLVVAGMVDRENGKLRPISACGAGADGMGSLVIDLDPQSVNGSGMGVQALRVAAPAVCHDIREVAPAESWCARAVAKGIQSAAYIPIVREAESAGLVTFYAGNRETFDDEEVRLLEGLIAEVAFALESIAKAHRIEYLASHDPLTGLPDAQLLEGDIDAALQSVLGGRDARTAVVMLDIERLKMVNDAFGKKAGDDLLRQIARRLGKISGEGVRVSRTRSGPFVVSVGGLSSVDAVQRWIDAEVMQTLASPFSVNGDAHYVSARCGVAVSPEDGADGATLVARAESALLQAKKRGDRVVFYSPEMNAHIVHSLSIENELRRAIENEEFVLYYQPKLQLDDGHVTGLEALLRWQHPQRGLVSPGHFVGVLEDTGLIAELAPWLIGQAIGDTRLLNHRREQPLRIAVNVSQVQMRRRDFVESVARELKGVASAGCMLDIEITESLLIDNPEAAIEKLHLLCELGVGIAIDDFGTGYSSLAYIAKLPFDALKIDQSFVREMTGSRQSMAIVSSVVSLARSLDKISVAEGVETVEQNKLLRQLGCNQAQGYLHARPMPLEQVLEWLDARETT